MNKLKTYLAFTILFWYTVKASIKEFFTGKSTKNRHLLHDTVTHKPVDLTVYERNARFMDSTYLLKSDHPIMGKAEFFVMTVDRIPRKIGETVLATGNQAGYFDDMVILHNEEHDIEVKLPRRNVHVMFRIKR